MKMRIIKRVILTIAAAALFIVPVSIIALQSNTTKTAEASNYNNNNCNFICQGYYHASNKAKHPATNHCPVMYYSYITKSYSSCTHVPQPKPEQPKPVHQNKPAYNSYYSNNSKSYSYPYNTSSNYTTPSYSYSQGYSYNNSNSYGTTYVAEPYYQIPVPQPKQNYYDVYVEQPKQDYVDIFVPEPKTNTYTSYSDTSSYVDYYTPTYDTYSVGNANFDNPNSYETLTTGYIYSN